MKRNNLHIVTMAVVISAVVLGFVACRADVADHSPGRSGDKVEFGAFLQQNNEVRTRALDTVYITSDPYNMDFFIQLCSDDSDGSTEPYTEVGTYVVPSGYEGRLESKDETDVLNWHDLLSPHTFYAWNIPWDENWDPSEHEEDFSKGIEIKFENSSESEGYEENRNNAVYENFIGAKSDKTYSYKEHGKYVDLTFHHLVSKIKIGSFVLIESSGAIQENLKADVTFVGMPTVATFYPHPTDNGRPCVVPHDGVSLDDGVTYYIENSATSQDVFYICPEVDFSKIDFKVVINDKAYENYDTYYGTFDNVEFVREPGTDYDWNTGEGGVDDDGNPLSDEKILHAGEMMTLDIVLIPGVGPGLSIIISPWSTDDPQESQYHTYPGLYSDAEVREIIDIFINQKTYDDPEMKAMLDRLFEMYGSDEVIDDKKVFRLYENVTFNSNIFPIWKDYIIDGMGHSITLKTNPNNTSYVQGPYFNVGPVRDVWLTDGTNTIYIDKEGFVWIYDAETNGYKKTDNQLTEFTGNEKSYDISCKDGKVHKSTYYNNSISGN